MKNTQYLIPLFVFIFSTVMGQNKSDQVASSGIFIEGETVDSVMINDPDRKQTLMLHTSTFASVYTNAPSIIDEFKIGLRSKFKIHLPGESRYTYINFDLQNVTDAVDFNNFDNTYILEKGDNINCKLSQKYYQFFGNGSEKLNCQSEIYKLKYSPSRTELTLLSAKKYEDFFLISNKRMDSLFNLQIEIVNNYSSKLKNKMTRIMLANCYGNRYFPMLRGYFSMSKSSPNEFLDLINSMAYKENYKKINLKLNKELDEEVLIASPIYSNFLIEKIITGNLTNEKGNSINSSPILQELVFNEIKNSYEGLLREKLLTLFFYRFKNSDLNYLNQALDVIKDSEFMACILKIKETRSQGAFFFPFELQNDKGKIVKLSDFNKKVLILDFWYTGCENCAILHEGLRPVVEKYKYNPKVEFVSISIDKDKNSWIKSIALDRYTDPSRVNLYTNGLGFKHPVIEINNIKGYPSIFILKNGRVISSSPPRPSPSTTAKSAIEARAAFISIIEEALIEKNPESTGI